VNTYTTNEEVYSVGPNGHSTKYTLWLEIVELGSKITYQVDLDNATNDEEDENEDVRPLFESSSWIRVFRDPSMTRHYWRKIDNSKPKANK
jgi:hypothetical protein